MDATVEHHGLGQAKISDGTEHVMLGEQEPGFGAGGENAKVFCITEAAGAGPGGAVEHLGCSESGRLHQLELLDETPAVRHAVGTGVAAGDDAHADAWGALQAGMQVAWLNRGGHEWRYGDTRPHVQVSDLHALCGCWPDYNTEGR